MIRLENTGLSRKSRSRETGFTLPVVVHAATRGGRCPRLATGFASNSWSMGSHQKAAKDVEAELEARLEAAYDTDGVDRSLIRASLARTPTERVIELEDLLNTLATAHRVEPAR